MIYEDKNVYYIFSSVRRYFAKDFQTTLKTEKILTQVPNSAYLRFQEKLNDKKLTGIPFSFPQLWNSKSILTSSATVQIKPLNVITLKSVQNEAAKWFQYTAQINPAISFCRNTWKRMSQSKTKSNFPFYIGSIFHHTKTRLL